MEAISINSGRAAGGRPRVTKTCPGCGLCMGAREFHDHSVADCKETARFDRVWGSDTFRARFLDLSYYDHDERSMIPCNLAILARVNSRSASP